MLDPVSSPPPRLLVTGHFVRAGRVGGAEPMLYNLVRGLARQKLATTLLCGDADHLAPDFRAELAQSPVHLRTLGGAGSRFLAEQRACREAGPAEAILFPNYYVPPAVPRRVGRVGVVMHDFQYRHFPQYFSLKKRVWLRAAQAFAMRRADRVIGISTFVCEDAARLYGPALARKLVHIPNPLSWARFDAGRERPRPIAAPYILSVAAHYPHKNLETLIRAFALVAPREPDLQLVLCGQSYAGLAGVKQGGADLPGLVAQLGLADRVRTTGYVDDDALAQWYRHAAMFAFPSIFEGFGMPPVEALGFGLPTLTTARTALPEVTRGLAHAVADPHDPAEWAEALLTIVRDPARHGPDSAQSAALRAFYHPDRIAAEYASALLV